VIVGLVDNGSLEPDAHLSLRRVAAAISNRTGCRVEAVSWRHSDRIPAAALDGQPASTLQPWLQAALGRGERRFVLIPYFISPQGAIGSALRTTLDDLQTELGPFETAFTAGLADRDVIAPIAASLIRETISRDRLTRPAVIVVDHGGPSPVSAALRDKLAAKIRTQLGPVVGPLAAASMEGAEHAHNDPILATLLTQDGYNRGDVVIAPLFLSPGRHAGPKGDLVQIAALAVQAAANPGDGRPPAVLNLHFAELIGSHPLAAETLAANLRETLAQMGT